MSFYLSLYILELCTAVAYHYSKNHFAKEFTKFLCFLVLFIPAAIRYNIGIDYENYVMMFNTHSDYGEIGWHWIENIVRFCDLNVQWVFVISSFIIYGLLLKIDKKDFILLISLYLFLDYTESFNAVRNFISISIFIFSYYLFLEGKNKLSILVCCMGFFFHSSTILFLPLLIFSQCVNLNKKNVFVIVLISTFLIYKININTIIDKLSSFYSDFRYLRYFTSSKYGTKSGYFGLGSLIKWTMLLMSYLCCDERYCAKKEFSAISIGFIFLWISSMLFVKIQIFYRLTIIFSVVYLMMFRTYLYPSKNIYHLLGKISCFTYLFLFNFLGGLASNSNGSIPYTTIFSR